MFHIMMRHEGMPDRLFTSTTDETVAQYICECERWIWLDEDGVMYQLYIEEVLLDEND